MARTLTGMEIDALSTGSIRSLIRRCELVLASRTMCEDHSDGYDDGNSAYYKGGRATLEDYADVQRCEAYDPYDEYRRFCDNIE